MISLEIRANESLLYLVYLNTHLPDPCEINVYNWSIWLKHEKNAFPLLKPMEIHSEWINAEKAFHIKNVQMLCHPLSCWYSASEKHYTYCTCHHVQREICGSPQSPVPTTLYFGQRNQLPVVCYPMKYPYTKQVVCGHTLTKRTTTKFHIFLTHETLAN